jgi:uncharacterized protein YllA (UPF0747 family)
MVAGTSAQANEKGPYRMDPTVEGFEQIANALLEMRQRMQVLVAENRQLQEELAALRRGVGVMVVVEGQQFPLLTGSVTTVVDPVRTPF